MEERKKIIFKDFNEISNKDKRKILTGSIIPRPIAWVSTKNEDGSINLAPFSYFNIVARDVLSISFVQKKAGNKDTLRNILREKEAVIHSSSIMNLDMVNKSSDESLDYGVSEVDLLDIPLRDSKIISTPTVDLAEISFEVKLLQHVPVPNDDGTAKADLILLQVLGVSFDERVYDEAHNYILVDDLQPASRLAGKDYGSTEVIPDVKRD